MNIAEIVALLVMTGIVTYACFGGADFGAGIWDLTAGNDRRGAPLRALVDRAIGPVWEANHVWLIFVLVELWTGFPDAFAAVMESLWVPISLAGLGIVLRGAAFAFRKFSPTLAFARFYGFLFAISSVLTPFFFGTVVGAVASGRVPADGSGDPFTSWTGPSSLIGGTLAVLTCAFLAAVFLTHEAARGNSPDHSLLEACRRRAIGSGLVTGLAAMAFLIPLQHDAETLFEELTGRALPLVVLSAVAGIITLALLWKRRYAVARASALVAVASVVAGWGVAQYPWMLMDSLTIEAAAGADATLWGLVIVFGIACVTVLPALAYLYVVTQRSAWVEHDDH